jgi:hypothetical protein
MPDWARPIPSVLKVLNCFPNTGVSENPRIIFLEGQSFYGEYFHSARKKKIPDNS